jgi:hypothetical protein
VIETRRIWVIAGGVAVIASGPVALYAKTMPWLIAIPIIVGVGLVVVLEFVKTPKEKKPSTAASDETPVTAGKPRGKR